jgi:hypothetical protein
MKRVLEEAGAAAVARALPFREEATGESSTRFKHGSSGLAGCWRLRTRHVREESLIC